MRRIVKGARNVGIEYDGPQRKGHYRVPNSGGFYTTFSVKIH